MDSLNVTRYAMERELFFLHYAERGIHAMHNVKKEGLSTLGWEYVNTFDQDAAMFNNN